MNISSPAIGLGYTDKTLDEAQVRDIAARALCNLDLRGKKVLCIVPDATRTAPVGLMFRTVFDLIGHEVKNLDVMIALGTHPAMSEEQINTRLEISADERAAKYFGVRYFNHAWDDPSVLQSVGTLKADEIHELSGGLFAMDVDVQINRAVFEYDLLLIIGPVFPHEVVGFSGGNKYLFPGIGGPDILNFFHWLGAIVSNPKIIGCASTPVRRVVDRAGSMVTIPKMAFSMVVGGSGLSGLYAGTPEDSWAQAAALSDKLHIVYKDHAFHTVLSRAPVMYDDLWTGGKCMYKLEPVAADGGELIIYAPHISEVSVTHGKLIEEIGYHTRDYFLKQWDKFKHHPWGVLAHSSHVRGVGTWEDGIEKPRVQVTLATQIPPDVCAQINMGYRDPATIRIEEFENREDEGVLYIPKAGEMLYRLKNPPVWAQG